MSALDKYIVTEHDVLIIGAGGAGPRGFGQGVEIIPRQSDLLGRAIGAIDHGTEGGIATPQPDVKIAFLDGEIGRTGAAGQRQCKASTVESARLRNPKLPAVVRANREPDASNACPLRDHPAPPWGTSSSTVTPAGWMAQRYLV